MLDEFIGKKVVIDFHSEFVCLGLLKAFDDHFLDVRNCDLHDLRDTDNTRENYVAGSVSTGVKRNRKRVLVSRKDVIAISLMEEVVDD
jgi:small nuclear ribonucleoprotein (snRNP)-like protein